MAGIISEISSVYKNNVFYQKSLLFAIILHVSILLFYGMLSASIFSHGLYVNGNLRRLSGSNFHIGGRGLSARGLDQSVLHRPRGPPVWFGEVNWSSLGNCQSFLVLSKVLADLFVRDMSFTVYNLDLFSNCLF